MNFQKKCLALAYMGVMFFMLISCASPQQKAEKLARVHPDWPPRLIEQIAEGQVTKGMTPDMVADAMGKRGDSHVNEVGEEVWTYYRGYYEYDYGAIWVPVYFVYFKNDRVVRTEGNRNEVFTW